MIDAIELENFGCVRKARIALTPLHAFVGPNDSGKTTTLRAIDAITQVASRGRCWLTAPSDMGIKRSQQGRAVTDDRTCLLRAEVPSGAYGMKRSGQVLEEFEAPTGREPVLRSHDVGDDPVRAWIARDVAIHLQGTCIIRLDPGKLRQSTGLVPESEALTFLIDGRRGLPAIYYVLLSRGDEAFGNIAARVRKLFPAVENLRVPATSHGTLELELELTDGTGVPADRMSDGLIYYLALGELWLSYANGNDERPLIAGVE